MATGITSRAATARVPRPLVDDVLPDEPMEDRADKPDAIEQANALFWKPPALDEVMADVAPITSWDALDIPDLTDEERETFAAALDE
jgi:hypothetical protein